MNKTIKLKTHLHPSSSMQLKMVISSSSRNLINQVMLKGWCLRFMANRISCLQLPLDNHNSKCTSSSRSRSTNKSIRIIKSDGGVRIYHRPIKAWELMEEFPKHLLCRSDSFYIGQKTPALSQQDRLQPGHNYFLLPATFFQSVLSFASFLKCRSNFASGQLVPLLFQVEKTQSGSLRIMLSEDQYLIDVHQLEPEAEAEEDKEILGTRSVCTTPQLRKEYEQLVVRRHQWKPKLDTIAERRKIHWGGRGQKRKIITTTKMKKFL